MQVNLILVGYINLKNILKKKYLVNNMETKKGELLTSSGIKVSFPRIR